MRVYIPAISLHCTDRELPSPTPGCKHVFLYCNGICSVLLIIKVSHMSFASPQEHHLTLQCCNRSLRWRAQEGVLTHWVAAEPSLAAAGPCPLRGLAAQRPWISRNRQEVVPGGSVSNSQIPLASLWFVFVS